MKESVLKKIGYFKKNHHKVFFVCSVIFYLIISGAFYATSITCFVNSENSNIITSGISGIALIISRYVLPTFNLEIDVYRGMRGMRSGNFLKKVSRTLQKLSNKKGLI